MRRYAMLSFALTLALTPAIASQVTSQTVAEPEPIAMVQASFISPVIAVAETVAEVTEALDDLQQAEALSNQEEARLARQVDTTRHQAEVAERKRLAAEAAAAAAAEAAEQERRAKASAAAVPSGSVWDRLAQCESNGDWGYGPHSGWGSGIYHGGLQFHPNTWSAYGGRQYATYAYQASREQQIAVAERVLAAQGWGAWPACSRKLGLR